MHLLAANTKQHLPFRRLLAICRCLLLGLPQSDILCTAADDAVAAVLQERTLQQSGVSAEVLQEVLRALFLGVSRVSADELSRVLQDVMAWHGVGSLPDAAVTELAEQFR